MIAKNYQGRRQKNFKGGNRQDGARAPRLPPLLAMAEYGVHEPMD